MNTLPDAYRCHCQVPRPTMHLGEDTGLCSACTEIYDERLYEMRLRQHTTGYDFDSLGDFLSHHDPHFMSKTQGQSL